MKKMIILTGLLVTMLTGCGNTEEVNEVENVNVATTVCDRAIELSEEVVENVYDEIYLTEEEFEEMRDETKIWTKEDLVEEGASEACIEETMKLIDSIEYDPTLVYCFDAEYLEREFVRILWNYDMIPAEVKEEFVTYDTFCLAMGLIEM